MKTNKNGVKLLATIMVFAMAFAGIVIINDDGGDVDAAVVSTPLGDLDNTKATFDSTTKVLTVTDNITITLTKDVGTSAEPAISSIAVADGKTITFTTNGTTTYTVYIGFVGAADDSSDIAAKGAVYCSNATKSATLITSGYAALDISYESKKTNQSTHAICDMDVTMSEHSKISIKAVGEEGNTLGTAICKQDSANNIDITMSNYSSLTLNRAGGFLNIATTTLNDNAKIDVKNPVTPSTYNLGTLTTGTSTSISVTGGNTNSFTGAVNMNIGSSVAGTITSETGRLNINTTESTSGTITLTNGTLKVNQIKSISDVQLTFSGGKIYADLIMGNETATTYILSSCEFTGSIGDAFSATKLTAGKVVLTPVRTTGAAQTSIPGLSGNYTVASDGTIYITGDAELTAATTFSGKVIVQEDAKLDLKTYELTNNSSLIILGEVDRTDSNGKITAGTGSVAVGDNAEVNSVSLGNSVVSVSALTDGSFGMKNELLSDYTVDGSAFLAGDLTIPEGITLTIGSDGVLDLNKNKLFILGNLVIETGGCINGTNNTTSEEGLFIGKNGSIQNDGIIGSSTAVKVTVSITGATCVGIATIQNVDGINFGMKKSVSGETVTYTLTVSGDIVKNGEGTATVGLQRVFIDKDMTIGEDVTMTATTSVLVKGGATLTIDGTLNAAGAVTMENKSTIIVNGYVYGAIIAQTGVYNTASGYSTSGTGNTSTITFPTMSSMTPSATEGVTSITITIGTYSYTDTWTDPTNPVAKTSQRMYISGNLDYVKYVDGSSITTARVTLSLAGNAAYIAEDSTLNLKKGMLIDTTTANPDSKIVVQGALISADAITATTLYEGTYFNIKTEATATVASYTTYYIKPFDVAIAEIDTADKKTLTVKDGSVTIDSELVLTEGQSINFDTSSTVTITSTGKVTVNSKAKIDGTIDNVDGSLVKMTGASCTVPTNYAAYVKGTGYEQWAGFQVAIDAAGEGETITINKAVTISSGDVTIPAGKKVVASENITVSDGNVSVAGTLVLKDGAKLDIVGSKKNLTITGEVDASEGVIDLSTTGKLNSTSGKTTLAPGQTTITLASDVNGTVYVDEDNNIVITAAQAAIDAAAAQDYNKAVTFYGIVSVDTLNIKVNATVDSGAVVSIGNATIADKKSVTLSGKTTGTFTAQTGVEDSTTGALTTSGISFNEAKGVTIGSATLTDSMNIKTKILYIYGMLVGSAETTEGIVSVGKDTTTNTTLVVSEAVFTIGKDSTLDVRKDTILSVGLMTITSSNKTASLVINGNVNVAGTFQNAGVKGIIDVNGSLNIADEVNTSFTGDINISGEITISTTEDKEATLAVNGVITVFDAASINGNVTIGNNASYYILAFTGADMEDALLNVDPATGRTTTINTVFYINSDAYMTVYAKNTGVVAYGVINSVEFSVDGLNLDDIKDVGLNGKINWFTKEDCKADSQITNTQTLNNTPALYHEADVAEVTGTISEGVGLKLYLNGVSIDNYLVYGGYSIPVGTYKVAIENLSGYDKSNAVISFNGATVADGGSIEFSENGFVLTATGATPAVTPTPEPTPTPTPEKDDSMGITEYLLIVLVILAAILVVVVAIRMMRS